MFSTKRFVRREVSMTPHACKPDLQNLSQLRPHVSHCVEGKIGQEDIAGQGRFTVSIDVVKCHELRQILESHEALSRDMQSNFFEIIEFD